MFVLSFSVLKPPSRMVAAQTSCSARRRRARGPSSPRESPALQYPQPAVRHWYVIAVIATTTPGAERQHVVAVIPLFALHATAGGITGAGHQYQDEYPSTSATTSKQRPSGSREELRCLHARPADRQVIADPPRRRPPLKVVTMICAAPGKTRVQGNGRHG